MTSKGMHRDNVSQTTQSYILIPNTGNKLPERIESAQAMRLVQQSADHADYDQALLKISDRIQGDQDLESQVRGYWMTDKGLLIHGTMDAAFRLTQVSDLKKTAEVSASNVTFLGDIRQKFKGSVDHYTGRAIEGLQGISYAFDGFAGAQAAQRAFTSNEPKYALAA